jgi:hypothetical protein
LALFIAVVTAPSTCPIWPTSAAKKAVSSEFINEFATADAEDGFTKIFVVEVPGLL